MNDRPFSFTTLTTGQELPNVSKVIDLSKISADFGRTIFANTRKKQLQARDRRGLIVWWQRFSTPISRRNIQ